MRAHAKKTCLLNIVDIRWFSGRFTGRTWLGPFCIIWRKQRFDCILIRFIDRPTELFASVFAQSSSDVVARAWIQFLGTVVWMDNTCQRKF